MGSFTHKPLVSVCTITYGHEKFIKDTINGVLMQEVDFPIEFIISDDCSPDKTEKVVQYYIDNHPKGNWIKYTKHAINKGMNPNFVWALNQCKGNYIALCEGDDYWVDPLKLQKQVDFLENNPGFTICFHKVKVLQDKNFSTDENIENRFPLNMDGVASLDDLLLNGNFINTTSVVFKSNLIINDLPNELLYSPVGDYILHVINAKKGLIKRFDDKMAVYRKGVGIYSTLDSLSFTRNMIKYQAILLPLLDNSNQREIIIKKLFNNIENYERSVLSFYNISANLSFINLLKVLLIKFKTIFK